ncbi:MAG TPA: hypothetical protein VKG92_07720, partial [Flavobacteriales bacterium]|nr:hypothetical protein [Flavobacteriales bacterium]
MDGPWSDPDIVVLGVKLDEVYYGMHVKVIGAFVGDVEVGDTLMVWGDNGGLCRWYAGSWANGDTVLWAFHNTDFMGNFITAGFPPDLEQPGDYHILICGTFWLDYANGVVTGPVEPGVSTMLLAELQTLVNGCFGTGVSEVRSTDPLLVRDAEDGPWLSLTTKRRVQLIVVDEMGRSCIARDWDGAPVQLSGMAAGGYLVQVQAG